MTPRGRRSPLASASGHVLDFNPGHTVRPQVLKYVHRPRSGREFYVAVTAFGTLYSLV